MDTSWWFLGSSGLAVSAGIVVLSFISEDAATLSSALLVLGGPIAWPLGFLSCFFGIWAGDVGLYSAARWFGKPLRASRWCQRALPDRAMVRCEEQFQRSGIVALLVSRFVPGTRLPTYLAAGFFAMPLTRFAWVTAVGALVWIGAIFALTRLFGAQALSLFASAESKAAPVILTALGVVVAVWALRLRLPHAFQRLTRWEFWPAWLFYLPIAACYLWFGLRHRSWSLPTAANPAIPTGGMVGESKIDILNALRARSSEFVADAYAINGDTATDRLLALHRIRREHDIPLPFILKPDLGQRGNGVKLIRAMPEALNYFQKVRAPVIVQRYAPGPHEAGIFYYRFPGAEHGRLFSITEKIFPTVTGDGIRTLAELITDDPRAAIIAPTYLQRFAGRHDEVLARGHKLKLVESGNHAQGCIFRDGNRLGTPALLSTIDAISRRLPGFFIGRYDVRYESEHDLMAGRNFQIVELNGAASEATHVYDPGNTLPSAYGTLFQQWRLVFAIGAANRARGHRPSSLLTLWREWRKYARAAASYPAAD